MTDRYDAGMEMRRAVLGDDHVDRAEATKTELTEDFQAFITRYAWGEVWTRPGLDRRTRSVITLTALIALGHWEELGMHVAAGRYPLKASMAQGWRLTALLCRLSRDWAPAASSPASRQPAH